MDETWRDFRKQYGRRTLDESQVGSDPISLLEEWIAGALTAGCPEPTAMVLSTVAAEGRPSSRVVLMKGLEASGITFFTNYDSRKGFELTTNPQAALLFFWPEEERQVRVEGDVARISQGESDAYFRSRPPESRLSAIVSPQSREIPGCEWLQQQRKLKKNLTAASLGDRPGNWGGFRLHPNYFEFWQGREDRLHDRIVFQKKDAAWCISRLAP